MRKLVVILTATVALAGAAAADPFPVAAGEPPAIAAGFEGAMARIEARVLQFAGSGGVVEQFISPYEPMAMPDPTYLIEFNRALAAYWTDSVDAAVEDFLISQVALRDRMHINPAFPVWQPVVAVPDLIANDTIQAAGVTGGAGNFSPDVLSEQDASGPLFGNEAASSVVSEEAGFFGDN